ncbi:sodium:solute symporter family protein [Aneurinibacillus tyrosinisolvens]|uniref:sodium:solute symporter family protein n=1 Tax=Aneurinibacillus tyrosinisolvens TaxID=1443435 RepID=UPI00063F3F27|nr:sodium/solute symporter [Aneurinibacillus tyrosinisolvens]
MFEVSSTFYVVLVIYFVVILGIGIWAGRTNKDSEDFLVAGRSIGPLVGGAAFAATQMSAGTFVGTLGVHYMTGGSFLWIWAGLWMGWLVAATLVGPKFQSFKGLTVPDYVGTRFNSKAARAISALLILIAYTVLLTAQYQAGGNIFQTLFGIPFIWGAIITVGITLLYTMKGGMRATAYSDFVQAVIMAGCFFAVLPLLFQEAGGSEFVGKFLTELNPKITGWHFGFKDLLGFGASFGFAMAAAPYELARMYTLRDKRTVKLAIGFSFIFQAIVGISVAAAGMAVRTLFPYMATPDIASTIMAINIMPPVIGSLIILAILSAIMSTVSGVMMVSASAFSHDFYATMIKPNATDQERIKVNRIAILVLGIIPIFLALKKFDIVQFIVTLQASLTASFFFATVVLGLNWKRGTAAGAIVSMILGFFTALFWYIAGKPFGLSEVIPGVAVSLLSFVIVSLFTKPVPKEALQPFFDDVT